MHKKILIIDDDPGLLTLLSLGLERDGFTVVTAEDGEEGLRQAYENHPDIIILDIMMPDMDGWETCQRLRYICDIPIIMLTAKSEKESLLRGFSQGADDYVTKPCSLDELTARIRAVLHRTAPNFNTWRLAYDDGHLKIDLKSGLVKREDDIIHLTPTESRLLMHLVSQKGQVVPHKDLLTSAWGPEYTDEGSYLSVYIRYLRQKIEDDPSNPSYIRTRWGIGYYFAGDGTLRSNDKHTLDEEQA